MAESLRICLLGASGRMGMAILGVAQEVASSLKKDFAFVQGIVSEKSPHLGKPLLGLVAPVASFSALGSTPIDVVIDFSSPGGTKHGLDFCLKKKLPLVIGTTGLGAEIDKAITDASKQIAILRSGNMSIGVNVMEQLVGQACRMFGESVDVEVVEMHHRNKVDAPSGTAVMLGNVISRERGTVLGDIRCDGRSGHVGARKSGELGMHAVRGGDVVGEHSVYFFGAGERIEIIHRATDRKIFARGALQAATWVVGQKPGLYSIRDML